MKLLNSAVAGFLLTIPLVVLAQPTPNFDQRQANQEQRIQQGVQSGSLTSQEAARLQRGQERLQSMETRAKADGVVSRQERAQMQRAADRQSEQIYRQKHDRQHDFNHDGRNDRTRRGSR